LLERVAPLGKPVGAHLHNTRNTGYANAYAALASGAEILDASVGGLGGCPFVPRATGNIATEDLLYLLEGEGVETGVELAALIEVAAWLESLFGRQLPASSTAPVFPSSNEGLSSLAGGISRIGPPGPREYRGRVCGALRQLGTTRRGSH
jgi:HMGL-like